MLSGTGSFPVCLWRNNSAGSGVCSVIVVGGWEASTCRFCSQRLHAEISQEVISLTFAQDTRCVADGPQLGDGSVGGSWRFVDH